MRDAQFAALKNALDGKYFGNFEYWSKMILTSINFKWTDLLHPTACNWKWKNGSGFYHSSLRQIVILFGTTKPIARNQLHIQILANCARIENSFALTPKLWNGFQSVYMDAWCLCGFKPNWSSKCMNITAMMNNKYKYSLDNLLRNGHVNSRRSQWFSGVIASSIFTWWRSGFIGFSDV